MVDGRPQDELSLAVLTPPGRAAIASVALFGANAWNVVNTTRAAAARRVSRLLSRSTPSTANQAAALWSSSTRVGK